MQQFYGVLTLLSFYPLFRAWRSNRRTSLAHAVGWAAAAWTAWGLALVLGSPQNAGLDPGRYIALCLTSGAGVAVLGARRPQVQAWNFVVVGLLAVMLLPLAETLFLRTPALGAVRVFFLAATLSVGIGNYVPTLFAIPALLFGCACLAECWFLVPGTDPAEEAMVITHAGLLLAPWLALLLSNSCKPQHLAMDRLWVAFRNRFGLFWGQRVREQYNRSAAQARLPGYLSWQCWKSRENEDLPTTAQAAEMKSILQAVIKRFGEIK